MPEFAEGVQRVDRGRTGGGRGKGEKEDRGEGGGSRRRGRYRREEGAVVVFGLVKNSRGGREEALS